MKITEREKRFLVVGGIVCAAALFLFLSSQVLPDREDLTGTVKFKRELLRRQKWTLSQEETYQNLVNQYQERLERDKIRFLAGDNPSSAGAELIRLLQDVADRTGVEVARKTNKGEQKLQDNVVKVSVQFETNCDPEQLVRFLAAVESYEKFLTVDELAINGFQLRNKFQIRPTISVAGYILSSEGKTGAKPAGGSF